MSRCWTDNESKSARIQQTANGIISHIQIALGLCQNAYVSSWETNSYENEFRLHANQTYFHAERFVRRLFLKQSHKVNGNSLLFNLILQLKRRCLQFSLIEMKRRFTNGHNCHTLFTFL